MKKLSKLLSLVLSLALCAGMVSPAFAASFSDLQDAIDNIDDVSSPSIAPDESEDDDVHANGSKIYNDQGYFTGRFGYGWNEEAKETASKGWDIWAWDSWDAEAGKLVRNVQLNEDVEFNKEAGDESGIHIDRNDNVYLDLNGHDIDLNPGAELNAEDGKFYRTDENGEKQQVSAEDLNTGSVITIDDGGKLTLDNKDADDVGKVTGGYGDRGDGNGVYNNGTFNMQAGAISGNTSSGVYNKNQFDMNGGAISGNAGNGVSNFRTFNMNAGTISDGGVYTDSYMGNVRSNYAKGAVITDKAGNMTVYLKASTEADQGKGRGVAFTGERVTKRVDGDQTIITTQKDSKQVVTTLTLPEGEDVTINTEAGTVDLPKGTVAESVDQPPYTYPDGAFICTDGIRVPEGGRMLEMKDGVILTEYVFPSGGGLDSDGGWYIPEGQWATGKADSEMDGQPGTAVAFAHMNDEGDLEVIGEFFISSEGEVTIDTETGVVTIPADGTVHLSDSETLTFPDGAFICTDGIHIPEGSRVIDHYSEGVVELVFPDGGGVDLDDCGYAPEGKTVTSKCDDTLDDKQGTRVEFLSMVEPGNFEPVCDSFFVSSESEVTIDPKTGNVEVPAGGEITRVSSDGESVETITAGEYGVTIYPDGTIKQNDPPEEKPDTPDTPDTPVTPVTPVVAGYGVSVVPGVSTTTIADQNVPLAGLVSREMLLSQLYIHEGSPDGEDAEGEYTKALAWGIENDIVDEDADPEEIVTVAILKDIMSRYAEFLGVTFDVEIPGEDDDVVMNCDEILNKFFNTLEDKAA